MSLNTLVDYISNSQITSELIKRISKNNELNIVGSSRYAKSIILDSIAKKEEKNILLICPNVEIAYKWVGYFESINDKAVLYYPPTEHLPYFSINKSKEIEFSQLTVLSKLIKKEKNELNIVISTERSLQPHLINKKFLLFLSDLLFWFLNLKSFKRLNPMFFRKNHFFFCVAHSNFFFFISNFANKNRPYQMISIIFVNFSFTIKK